jgi:hypothetical protein
MNENWNPAIIIALIVLLCILTPCYLYHGRELNRMEIQKEIIKNGGNPIDAFCMTHGDNGILSTAVVCALRATGVEVKQKQ